VALPPPLSPLKPRKGEKLAETLEKTLVIRGVFPNEGSDFVDVRFEDFEGKASTKNKKTITAARAAKDAGKPVKVKLATNGEYNGVPQYYLNGVTLAEGTETTPTNTTVTNGSGNPSKKNEKDVVVGVQWAYGRALENATAFSDELSFPLTQEDAEKLQITAETILALRDKTVAKLLS